MSSSFFEFAQVIVPYPLIPAIAFSDQVSAASAQFPDEYFYDCVMQAYYEAMTLITYEVKRDTAEIRAAYDQQQLIALSDQEVYEPVLLSEEQLRMIHSLYCEGNFDYGDGDCFVRDTTGIELLTNLNFLRLYGNNISSLDLSQNKKLEVVDVPGNNISSLKLPQGHHPWGLKVNGNWLQNLDLSNNLGIEVLFLDGNPFSGYVDLTENYSLQHLYSGDAFVYLGNQAEYGEDGAIRVDLHNLDDYGIDFLEVLESDYYAVDENDPYTLIYSRYNETTPQFIEVATDESIIKLWIDFSELLTKKDIPAIPDTSGVSMPSTPNTGAFTKEDESVKAINIGIAVLAVLSSAFLVAFIFKRIRKSVHIRRF